MTLWHGIFIGKGFLPIAFATALTAFGLPTALATSKYVLVLPFGIFIKYFQTLICSSVPFNFIFDIFLS